MFKQIETEHHKCESIRNGSIITFYCPKCRDYKRTINLDTNEETVVGDSMICHSGFYYPPTLNTNYVSMN